MPKPTSLIDATELSQENSELRGECLKYAEQVEALRTELAETNQGVVALYAELDDQAAALREATALKSRFLSYMSHEFRTPLGAIRSIARILLDRLDGPLTAEQEKQVCFIQSSAVELTEMVGDLLDLAKIEAGRVTISREWFAMVDLFAALRGMFKPILSTDSISLIFEEPEDIPRIYTDHKKLSQILRNYISNALKFTPEGKVRVTARRDGDEHVTFSVADTGIGIALEHQSAIFQDFVQVDSPLQRKWRGTGIGLALSKKVAELLGGSVSMTSEVNVGSTFSVTIPIGIDDHVTELSKGAPHLIWSRSPMPKELTTVLVVDDNAATLYSTSRVLRNEGFRVVEASTGAEAIRLASGDIDLAILDINLPDIDGYEVCRRIREIKTPPRLPVVHLSASFVTDRDRVHGLELGADGYITHPVEPPVLIATVKAFLRIRQAEIEREQLLANERAARAEAERANRFKDEFLATLSHELRTPLQSMLGWAQVLKFGQPTPEEIAEGIDAIERNAQLQSQMIADLLDVARITSGKLELDVRPVDLAALIEAVASDAAPAAGVKGVCVITDLRESIEPVEGDSVRLQQVIRNLVNNAVKFTPAGGKIELALCHAGPNIEISVTDNGEGIAPEFLPRIFERFLQGDASTNRRHGGLGLGLAIVRQIIEMHGGNVRAESKGLGTGSRFVVQLPAVQPSAMITPAQKPPRKDAADTAVANAPKPQRLDGVRVLLIDDNEDARRVLSRLLSASGATIKECEGVQSALDTLQEFRPQILISDLGMPGKDGYELIRTVRELGYSADVLPAIALTAFAQSQDCERVLLAGFQLHLAKPVTPPELTAAIASLCCPAAKS